MNLPDDCKAVILSARKNRPLQVVSMTTNDLYSTKSLENQITNRKIDTTKEKVQWLNYKKEQPFKFNYKYSNNPDYPFYCVNIGKRKSKIEDYTTNLDLFISKWSHYKPIKKKRFN